MSSQISKSSLKSLLLRAAVIPRSLPKTETLNYIMLCSQFALTHLFDKGVVLKVLFWYKKGQTICTLCLFLITKMLLSSYPHLPIHKRPKRTIRSQKAIEKSIQNHKKFRSKLKTAYKTIQTNQISTPIIRCGIKS